MDFKRHYRYHIYNDNGVIVTICVANYKGQNVRGIAKCMPTDEYNEALGKEIAKRRVDVKIAKKKLNNMLIAYTDNLLACESLMADRDALVKKINRVKTFIDVNED